MARLTTGIAGVAKCMLPYGLVALPGILRARSARAAERALLAKLSANAVLRGRHAGRRCFILCSGPSVRTQNLRRLAGEFVISVSSAYLHPDYESFRPAYHCVPHITFGKFTEQDAVRWFRDMDERIGQAEIILCEEQRALVDAHGLMADRPVHYLSLQGDAPTPVRGSIPDLTGPVPRPQSVPIMALMIALYMGCREIYLLGTDHDHFLTGTYTHFYDKAITTGRDPSVGDAHRVLSPRYEQFHELTQLWRQYRWLKECCVGTGAVIYNATAGGALDEFERVDFASLRLSGDALANPVTTACTR